MSLAVAAPLCSERLGGGGFLRGAVAAMLRGDELYAGLGFGELLLQARVGSAQGLGFEGLVGVLLFEAFGHALMGESALDGGAGEVVLLAGDGELGLAQPLQAEVVLLSFFLEQEMLVGDGDGYLGFDLEELVLHVEDELAGQLGGVLGLGEEVVEVGAEEGGDAFEEGHDGVPFWWNEQQQMQRPNTGILAAPE